MDERGAEKRRVMDLKNENIESFLNHCIAKELFPGAVYLVGEKNRIIALGAVGHSVVDPMRIEMNEDTIFDLASLTKPLCTALLAVICAKNKVFNLNDRIWKFLPFFKEGEKQEMKIIHLLTHTSGIPRWAPLYLHGDDLASKIRYLNTLRLKFRPGEKVLYGCPGYIVLAEVIRKASGERIDRLLRELIAGPLHLKDTEFDPPLSKRKRIAASEKGNQFERELAGKDAKRYIGYRKEIIWGRVHDHNSFTLDGVSGNAGLFSNAREIFALSGEFLEGGNRILDRAEKKLFFKNFTEGLNEDRSAGWQIASTRRSSAGSHLSRDSIGHTGFTGVSLWIDPERVRTNILLTNRTHPAYKNFNMNAIRRRFHRLASSI